VRSYAWKAAVIGIALCYPAASLVGRLVNYIGLQAQHDPSLSDQSQVLRLGLLAFIATAIFAWFIAFFSGVESTRVDNEIELRLGRFAFAMVLTATLIYVVALNIPRV
jgi:hypothetical protein